MNIFADSLPPLSEMVSGNSETDSFPLDSLENPFTLFRQWFAEAEAAELNDPNAMALATTDAANLPDVRMVLLKSLSGEGFVFYTNKNSSKALQLKDNMKAAAVFHWKSLRKQIRIRGPVTELSEEEAKAYFHTRPHDSQISSWASQQSRSLPSRMDLEKAVAEYAARYESDPVPVPPHWCGFRILPLSIEFWHDRPFRLHERLQFYRSNVADAWLKQLLYP